ncbi:acyl-ACP--UDP-N-acetylglucosamine O-acyltransferase [Chrysiogenes arsenatis]|uniref:acyl-ACP--UDP-N-acetylglucosamine O-acyltransferase n=1 Tax=Chrysiogenes arsenatis TaxID=309797 RepID=UPI0004080608|nr:acyl-ACP--UDP-N-acetylglucosamine O-acyltransferase [Chrysiogenes arsenatis]
MNIHSTAIVSPQATLGDVVIGPYCVIGDHVTIGDGTVLHSHVVVKGHTTIGRENEFFSFSSIGEIPQDLKYRNEPTTLTIGNNNKIREFVTMNTGTVGGGGTTSLGDNNLLMAYVHVAHDCLIGNDNVLANGVTFAGHVIVHDRTVVGGLCAIHQFVTLGEGCMIGGGSMVAQDILPFIIAQGDRAGAVTINTVGLERRGYDKKEIELAKKGFRIIFRSGKSREEAIEDLLALDNTSYVIQKMVHFYRSSERGLARCRKKE